MRRVGFAGPSGTSSAVERGAWGAAPRPATRPPRRRPRCSPAPRCAAGGDCGRDCSVRAVGAHAAGPAGCRVDALGPLGAPPPAAAGAPTPPAALLRDYGLLLQLREVYVIMFDAAGLEEGLYTLRRMGRDELPREDVVAWESRTEAENYCGMLEALEPHHRPTVWALRPWALAAFCAERGYCCRLEGAGSRLTPPLARMAMTDWERALRLRQGIGFRVLDEEPQRVGPAAAAAAAAAPAHPAPPAAAEADAVSLLRALPAGVPLPLQLPLPLPPLGAGAAAGAGGGAHALPADLSALVARLEALLPPGGEPYVGGAPF